MYDIVRYGGKKKVLLLPRVIARQVVPSSAAASTCQGQPNHCDILECVASVDSSSRGGVKARH